MVSYVYQCRYKTFEKKRDVKKWWMSKTKCMFQLSYVGSTMDVRIVWIRNYDITPSDSIWPLRICTKVNGNPLNTEVHWFGYDGFPHPLQGWTYWQKSLATKIRTNSKLVKYDPNNTIDVSKGLSGYGTPHSDDGVLSMLIWLNFGEVPKMYSNSLREFIARIARN